MDLTDFDSKLQEKIIPAFEQAHGPEYQALIMVDNLPLSLLPR
jgi:hypothetical protein